MPSLDRNENATQASFGNATHEAAHASTVNPEADVTSKSASRRRVSLCTAPKYSKDDSGQGGIMVGESVGACVGDVGTRVGDSVGAVDDAGSVGAPDVGDGDTPPWHSKS